MQNRNACPLVSVIVPIYNVERYVEKCVDSILAQTYSNLEILLVNDGSTDGSRQKITQYERESRCRILDKPNGGLSSARNAGLDNATGEYVYFVDSDDYIVPDAVESLVQKMQETKADFCCYRIVFYSDDHTKISGKNFTNDILIGQEAIMEDAFLNKDIKTTAWSKFFSAEFLKCNSLRFKDGIINEDSLFTVLCAIYAHKVAFLDKPLYYAYQRPDSISRKIKRENITSYFNISAEIRNRLEQLAIFGKYRDYFYASFTKQMLYTLIQCGYRSATYTDFKALYENLKDSDYRNKKHGNNIRLAGRFYFLLYKLSLHPKLFFTLTKIFRFCGVYMP